jgi:hypothetical protein
MNRLGSSRRQALTFPTIPRFLVPMQVQGKRRPSMNRGAYLFSRLRVKRRALIVLAQKFRM